MSVILDYIYYIITKPYSKWYLNAEVTGSGIMAYWQMALFIDLIIVLHKVCLPGETSKTLFGFSVILCIVASFVILSYKHKRYIGKFKVLHARWRSESIMKIVLVSALIYLFIAVLTIIPILSVNM
jgi:hypothetical protein